MSQKLQNNRKFSGRSGRARKTSLVLTYITGCVNFRDGGRLIDLLILTSLWFSKALLLWEPPFSFIVYEFERCFPSSAGKPREVAIDFRSQLNIGRWAKPNLLFQFSIPILCLSWQKNEWMNYTPSLSFSLFRHLWIISTQTHCSVKLICGYNFAMFEEMKIPRIRQ